MIYRHAPPLPAMHASTAKPVGSYFLRSTLQESLPRLLPPHRLHTVKKLTQTEKKTFISLKFIPGWNVDAAAGGAAVMARSLYWMRIHHTSWSLHFFACVRKTCSVFSSSVVLGLNDDMFFTPTWFRNRHAAASLSVCAIIAYPRGGCEGLSTLFRRVGKMKGENVW